MLSELYVRDLAVIDRLDLDFGPGFTVLTGETGAGKSILLDALKLATGVRADAALVRHGAERAEVVARFELDQPLAGEADSDGELLLRRVVGSDGRSRAYVNDVPCPVGRLRALGERLLEIHGQHEHLLLTRADRQLALLDGAGGHGTLLEEVRRLAGAWREISERLAALRGETVLSEAERELLEFQVTELEPELEAARSIEALHDQHRRLAARQELAEIAARAREILGGAVAEGLGELRQGLERGSRLDAELTEARELVEAALIQAQEAERAVNRYDQALADGHESLESLEARLARLHDLARKHRVEPEALPARYEELAARLARAADAEGAERSLEREAEEAAAAFRGRARALSEARRETAARLGAEVTALMAELGMAAGRFEIGVEPLADDEPRPAGLDRVEFRVSTNPGLPLKPLAKVASGGELSRIGLALKVAGSEEDGPRALVFDEVDSGVGGAVAAILGARLRRLARGRQVFCITHLAQVAACGEHHFRVEKSVTGGATRTTVRALGSAQRVEEVARMIGGREITERTRDHARELLDDQA